MVSAVPESRWKWQQSGVSEGPVISKWGCFFSGLDLFDAAFFHISAREAKVLDPLHRMLLECAWESLESAGKNPLSMTETDFRTSVYVGIQSSEYQSIVKSGHMVTGTALSTAAGRVSYVLGITGEAMSIDTACSSSLVATASGCRSLQAGLTNNSLCMGVNAMVDSNVAVVMSQAGMLSPDGRCKTFDASANGFVRGEGCVSIVLKRWEEHKQALGRVVGHGVNQDGRSNGLTAPNGPAQVRLIRETLALAGIEAHDVQMVEAHGTGTSLGDPIEAQAVAEALGARERHSSFVMGSAKTNFGHTETAAGVLGILKVLMGMDHGCIPQHLHLSQLNEFIGLGLMEGMQCVVPQETVTWGESRKFAGVSSFGFSGTNAHVILESPKREQIIDSLTAADVGILALEVSGKTTSALSAQAVSYADALVRFGRWPELAATSVLQRPKFAARLMVVSRSAKEAVKLLRSSHSISAGAVQVMGESDSSDRETVESRMRRFLGAGALLPTTRFERKSYWVDLEDKLERQSFYAVVWKPIEAVQSRSKEKKIRVLGGSLSARKIVAKQLARRGFVEDSIDKGVDFKVTIVWLGWQDAQKEQLALLQLLQGLAKNRVQKLLVASRGGVRVREGERVSSAGQAALWGLGRVARVEQPEVNCVNVDVDSLEAVVAEVENEDGRAYECAYREGVRLVPVMEQLVGGKRSGSTASKSGVAPNGVKFLVTGGFGALANGCVTWMVQGEARGAVLVGRRGAQEEHTGLLQRCEQLEEGVVCVRADSSVAGDVKGMVAAAGVFEGLLHLAGEGSAALLSKTRGRMLASSFKPKVGTLKNLERAGVALNALKASVLFSSQATMVPVHGQGAYAAANMAMEAFATSTSVTVCWGAFADVGMYLLMSRKQMEAELRYWIPLESESIPRLLRRAGELGKSEVGVFNVKWATFPLRGPSIYEELQSKEAPASQREKEVKRAEAVDVESVVKEVLGMAAEDVLDLDAPMQDLGFDSVMSVELSQRLSQMLDVRVSATVAYDYPSVRQLKDHLEESRTVSSPEASPVVPVAVSEKIIEFVGSACRFSSAKDVSQLWGMFASGGDQIILVPGSRWSWKANYGEGKSVSKWGGFMEGIDEFDAAFFGISPREARTMDPQHRMLLECAWEAVEAAGYDHNSLREQRSAVSVYVGIQNSEYEVLLGRSSQNITATGISLSVAAGRISYVLGWTGEALSIDTACSSSLVAMVQGFKSVERGDSKMSLCCGVNAMLDGNVFVILSTAGMLSRDGRCKTFDGSADGYVRGEGCAALLVREWIESSMDSCVLRSAALNQDGRSNGLTAPNGPAQVKLVREALLKACLGGHDVQVLEAHGTGTSLGDPIEAQAVAESLGKRLSGNCLLMGSAKTNFGHTESASGALGVLKSILQMTKKQVFKHLHLRTLNEFIGVSLMESTQNVIPLESVSANVTFSGVSSFGFSGTNAHVLLELKRCTVASDTLSLRHQIVVLSSRTLFSLGKLKEGLKDQLVAGQEWSDVCSLANSMWFKRTKWPLRSAFVISSTKKCFVELAGADHKSRILNSTLTVCATDVWRLRSSSRRDFLALIPEQKVCEEKWVALGFTTRAGSIMIGLAVVNGLKMWGCVVEEVWGSEARLAIEKDFQFSAFVELFPDRQPWKESCELPLGGVTVETGRGFTGERRTAWIHASGCVRGGRSDFSMAVVAGLLVMSGKFEKLKWLKSEITEEEEQAQEDRNLINIK